MNDVLRPFDDLLEDRTFWTDFEISLVTALVPRFTEIFVAGAIAGVAVGDREKAYPSSLPDPLDPVDVIAAAGQAIRDYVPQFTKNISATTYREIKEAVLLARHEGTGVEGVVRDLSGIMSRSRAELIGVTETTRMFGLGAQASYRLQGFNAWRWMAVNDPWVDPVCAGLAADSETHPFPMDKLFEPAHPRCRCFPSPVLVDEPIPSAPAAPPPPPETILGGRYRSPKDFIKNALEKDLKSIYSVPGYETRVLSVDRSYRPGEDPYLRVTVQINKNGESYARSVRIFRGTDVHHDLLVVEDKFQGEGFAREFNARAEQAYREAGFKTISVNADIDVGKYAWSRQGFTFGDPRFDNPDYKTYKIEQYRQAYEDMLERWNIRRPSSAPFKDSAKVSHDLFEGVTDAWDIAALDDGELWDYKTHSTSGKAKLGKALMLNGASWDGVKYLDPESTSQQIFRAYLEEAKKKK